MADASDHQWVTCFQEIAEILLGKTSEEVGILSHDQAEFQNLFIQASLKKYLFRLKIKIENYNVSKNIILCLFNFLDASLADY